MRVRFADAAARSRSFLTSIDRFPRCKPTPPIDRIRLVSANVDSHEHKLKGLALSRRVGNPETNPVTDTGEAQGHIAMYPR